MASMTYKGTIVNKLKAMPEALAQHLVTALAPDAERLAETARNTHPWVSRSGRLEASIASSVKAEGRTVTISVGYDGTAVSDAGFPYGSRLETDYGGQFATLRPTLLNQQGDILAHAISVAKGGS